MQNIGIGYDIHRLTAGRKLVLGGVEIPAAKGLQGHSDADVVLHALIDALLGATGSGDIGDHFPDTDPQYRAIRSTQLLERAYAVVRGKGYVVQNVDIVVILEKPRLSALKAQIRSSVARLLQVDEACVSVKAKTNEGLGPIGQGKAIASFAVVSVIRK